MRSIRNRQARIIVKSVIFLLNQNAYDVTKTTQKNFHKYTGMKEHNLKIVLDRFEEIFSEELENPTIRNILSIAGSKTKLKGGNSYAIAAGEVFRKAQIRLVKELWR